MPRPAWLATIGTLIAVNLAADRRRDGTTLCASTLRPIARALGTAGTTLTLHAAAELLRHHLKET